MRCKMMHIRCAVLIIVLVGCSSPDDQLLPGAAHLMQRPAGCDFDALQMTQCFQAVYTREPDKRPEWFSFPLEVQVSL